MRLLQRYVLGELIRVFAFVLSLLTVLLVFVGVLREVSENGLGPFQALQILPYVVPSLLPFTIPATLLLTVCVVYGRIAGDQEITAAKAAGINVLSLLWPSFWLGCLLALCSLVLADRVIPWAVANIQRTVTNAMEDIFLDVLRSQHQVSDPDRGYSITVMDVRGKTLIMPTFQYTPRGHAPVTIQAAEATLQFDLDRQQVMLHLMEGVVDVPGHARVVFDREDHPFPLPHKIAQPKPRHLSIQDIRRLTREVKSRQREFQQRRDLDTAMALALGDFAQFTSERFRSFAHQLEFDRVDLCKLRTEIHSRFAMSCSCLCFALVGGPFSILQGRRQFLTSFFLCFLPILLVYYPVVLLMQNLSKSGTVSPVWSMWVGNLAVMVAAMLILRRVVRH